MPELPGLTSHRRADALLWKHATALNRGQRHTRAKAMPSNATLTPVRFAELGSSKHRVWIRDFDSSLLGRI